MAMILDVFMSKCCTLLADYVHEEVTMLLGAKGELQRLLGLMRSIQSLLQDAEQRRFDESQSSTEHWLSKLKDVMYDADDFIDLYRIEGVQLLADQNPKSRTSPVCCNFSFLFDCFKDVPLRDEIRNRIKILHARLDQIYEDRVWYKLEISAKLETPRIIQVDPRQTSSAVDPLVVGKEVEDAANRLVRRLVTENFEEKCRLFAVTGMGGIGKTTLAQKIFNHEIIKINFNLKVWVCVSQTYSEIELLQRIITGVEGSYENVNTKDELLHVLSDFVASGQSLFLVLDDVWTADVWVHLLRVPLHYANTTVRVLITTRNENVAKGMDAALPIHHVEQLSIESGWDLLRKSVFHNVEAEQEKKYESVGYEIVKKCGRLPLAIKAIAGVLTTKKAWDKIRSNKAWSSSWFPEEIRDALYLSFEDLPSLLKQCFLYLSLYPEDYLLKREEVARFWVAEGFITEQEENSIMEDVAEKYFNELVARNLLLPHDSSGHEIGCKMHVLIRSLALFLSKEESSFGIEKIKNSATSTKLRRLSVADISVPSAQFLDLIADQGGLRTLLASGSDLLLDHERLTQLSRLRLLDISSTGIEILPDSIGNLVHLRYLDLSYTKITTIPESIEHLAYLQFLLILRCKKLTQLPTGIIRLENLRCLSLSRSPLSFIPKGIGKLKQLNKLDGFVVANNDSSSQLEELNSLHQIKKLSIHILEGTKSGARILEELNFLSDLTLEFIENISERNVEDPLENLFDNLRPPRCLEKLVVTGFSGRYFPHWMNLFTFERHVPNLTKLSLIGITSCTRLPPLGQMPELRHLHIERVDIVEKIGPEFLGRDVTSAVNSSTWTAFPKLQELHICDMPMLEEWSFDAQVEENAFSRLTLLPCLCKVYIYYCPLLKQLPKGLKHSAMKSLDIIGANSLESLDDLPDKIEELFISSSKKLKTVCCLPSLKYLRVSSCDALSSVENLDSLQHLYYIDLKNKQSLPQWLLMLLQSQRLQKLELWCSWRVTHACLEGGSHWDLIRHIPRVTVFKPYSTKVYLRYNKQPYVYEIHPRLI